MKKIFLITLYFLIFTACFVEARPAYRIISLAPNTTEILFSLGLGNSIVGIDDFSNYPEEVKDIGRLGAFNSPNIERIILLKPDYILVNSNLGKAYQEYLEYLGIKIIKVSPKTIEGLYDDINKLGAIFGKQEDAQKIINNMRSRIMRIRYRHQNPAPKVFVQLFDDPLITTSFFINDVIRLAGGESIAQDIKNDSGIFSYELLIERNPDIILASGFSGEIANLRSINAVKNNKIFKGLDPDLILRPGPRAAEAIEQLNSIFYTPSH